MVSSFFCAITVQGLQKDHEPPDYIRGDCQALSVDGRESKVIDELRKLVSFRLVGNQKLC